MPGLAPCTPSLRVLPSTERAGGPGSTGVGEPSPPRSRPRGLCSLSQSLPSAWKYVGLPCPFDRFLIIPYVPPPPRSPPRSPGGFLQSSWAPSHPCTHLLLTASQPAWQRRLPGGGLSVRNLHTPGHRASLCLYWDLNQCVSNTFQKGPFLSVLGRE